MKLLALPWDRREDCRPSGLQPFVGIADEELDAMQAAILQRSPSWGHLLGEHDIPRLFAAYH
jgi:hypothetical protein